MAPLASLDERIRIAIAEKRLLEFRYNRAARLGEPRDYGVIDGTARLLIQLHGPDSGKRAVGWRLLDVAKIESCVVTNRHFAGCRANRTGILPEPNRIFVVKDDKRPGETADRREAYASAKSPFLAPLIARALQLGYPRALTPGSISDQ